MIKLNLIFTSLLILLSPHISWSQNDPGKTDTTNWKFSGAFNSNFSQAYLSNWAGGGENSVAVAAISNNNLDFKKNKFSWNAKLDMGYGVIRQGDKSALFKKTDDELIFLSKLMRSISKKWDIAFLTDFKTQFTEGYEYYNDTTGEEQKRKISNFLAPGYVINSIGIEYKSNDKLYAVLSPVASKTTIVLDEDLSEKGKFGVDPGKKLRQEYGANFNAGLSMTIMENVDLKSTLNLFSNYEDLAAIDVNWQAQLAMKINKFLTTTITTQTVYDQDVKIERSDGTEGPALQFKEVLAIGLSFKY